MTWIKEVLLFEDSGKFKLKAKNDKEDKMKKYGVNICGNYTTLGGRVINCNGGVTLEEVNAISRDIRDRDKQKED